MKTMVAQLNMEAAKCTTFIRWKFLHHFFPYFLFLVAVETVLAPPVSAAEKVLCDT